MFDVKNGIIKMTSENNQLEFDQFKPGPHAAIQGMLPCSIFEQTNSLS